MDDRWIPTKEKQKDVWGLKGNNSVHHPLSYQQIIDGSQWQANHHKPADGELELIQDTLKDIVNAHHKKCQPTPEKWKDLAYLLSAANQEEWKTIESILYFAKLAQHVENKMNLGCLPFSKEKSEEFTNIDSLEERRDKRWESIGESGRRYAREEIIKRLKSVSNRIKSIINEYSLKQPQRDDNFLNWQSKTSTEIQEYFSEIFSEEHKNILALDRQKYREYSINEQKQHKRMGAMMKQLYGYRSELLKRFPGCKLETWSPKA